MSEILKPAIDLASNGFPVQKITAHSWKNGMLLEMQVNKTTNEIDYFFMP